MPCPVGDKASVGGDCAVQVTSAPNNTAGLKQENNNKNKVSMNSLHNKKNMNISWALFVNATTHRRLHPPPSSQRRLQLQAAISFSP